MPTAHRPPPRDRGPLPAPPLPACAAALSLLLGAAGCDGCSSRARPYTPYTLGDEAGAPRSADAATPLDDAAAPDGGPAFAVVSGQQAPGDGKAWLLGPDTAVDAPAGRAFAVGLVRDLDGDGVPDLLAFARAPDGLHGELLFASGKTPGSPRTVGAVPDGLAVALCSARAGLDQVGPHTVAFDFEAHCPARLRAQAARWVALLRTGSATGPDLRLELRVNALPDDAALQLAFDGRDRDGDGSDDLAVTLSLHGALRPFTSGGLASATLAFLDRPAGFGRDPAEPAASFAAAAAALLPPARRKTSAADALAGARAVRLLHQLVCEEDGAPRVTTSAGTIPCGEAHALDDATYAEALSAATLHDPARAQGPLARIDGPRKKELAKLLARLAPEVPASIARRIAAVPSDAPLAAEGAAGPSRARWSPLAFEPNGDLLVRAASGVVRVDHQSLAEAPAADVAPWPALVGGPRGDTPAPDVKPWRLLGVDQACHGPTLTARVAEAGGDPSTLPLPVLSPITEGRRCREALDLRVTALDLADAGVLLGVAGETLLLDGSGASPVPAICAGDLCSSLPRVGARRALGSARSPDGATAAMATGHGVFVVTGNVARVWTGEGLDQAWGCVASTGAGRLACVTGGSALLYEPR